MQIVQVEKTKARMTDNRQLHTARGGILSTMDGGVVQKMQPRKCTVEETQAICRDVAMRVNDISNSRLLRDAYGQCAADCAALTRYEYRELAVTTSSTVDSTRSHHTDGAVFHLEHHARPGGPDDLDAKSHQWPTRREEHVSVCLSQLDLSSDLPSKLAQPPTSKTPQTSSSRPSSGEGP